MFEVRIVTKDRDKTPYQNLSLSLTTNVFDSWFLFHSYAYFVITNDDSTMKKNTRLKVQEK